MIYLIKKKKNEITYLNVVEALEREDRINGKMIELLKAEVGKMGNEKLNFEKFKKSKRETNILPDGINLYFV